MTTQRFHTGEARKASRRGRCCGVRRRRWCRSRRRATWTHPRVPAAAVPVCPPRRQHAEERRRNPGARRTWSRGRASRSPRARVSAGGTRGIRAREGGLPVGRSVMIREKEDEMKGRKEDGMKWKEGMARENGLKGKGDAAAFKRTRRGTTRRRGVSAARHRKAEKGKIDIIKSPRRCARAPPSSGAARAHDACQRPTQLPRPDACGTHLLLSCIHRRRTHAKVGVKERKHTKDTTALASIHSSDMKPTPTAKDARNAPDGVPSMCPAAEAPEGHLQCTRERPPRASDTQSVRASPTIRAGTEALDAPRGAEDLHDVPDDPRDTRTHAHTTPTARSQTTGPSTASISRSRRKR
ncbi:hypothetical protein C8R46DRAFT_1037947 [Mycena filopes]|nr:hypothetical protein C8R46DRAFT_1037947 [Mycena filopes]